MRRGERIEPLLFVLKALVAMNLDSISGDDQ